MFALLPDEAGRLYYEATQLPDSTPAHPVIPRPSSFQLPRYDMLFLGSNVLLSMRSGSSTVETRRLNITMLAGTSVLQNKY